MIPEPLTPEAIRAHIAKRGDLPPRTWRTTWLGGLERPDLGRPLLFLDIDGVLHPDGCDPAEHFCRWPLLEGVLDAVPDIDVVWASTWRYKRDWSELLAQVPKQLHPRFLGATPAHLYPRRPLCPDATRRLEVEAFLSDVLGDPSRPWVAVDDLRILYGDDTRVYICNPRTGLTPADATALAYLLTQNSNTSAAAVF
ncbi:HAD domain-containing protein [Paraburkholderia xenovorans]